jgi:hypothetical protein
MSSWSLSTASPTGCRIGDPVHRLHRPAESKGFWTQGSAIMCGVNLTVPEMSAHRKLAGTRKPIALRFALLLQRMCRRGFAHLIRA